MAAFSAPTVRAADERLLDRVSAFSTAMPIGPLSADELAVLAAVRAWHEPAANVSKHASAAPRGVPRVVVRGRGTAASTPPLSRNFAKLRLEDDWETGILPAMQKEIGGLVDSEVWEEVPFEPGMQIIPTHRIDERRGDKNKTRLVAEGNRTVAGVHFGEVSTSMPTQTEVKMVVSFAAGLGQGVFAVDFTLRERALWASGFAYRVADFAGRDENG